MILYTKEQLEEAGRWEDTDLNMSHLDQLLGRFHDARFVTPALGSHQLRRRFPDDFRKWIRILGTYRRECKATAISLLQGDRDSKEHALNLINRLELYDRDVLDAIARVAVEDYYPTQTRSLLAFWRVSGRQFGLEAESPQSAPGQASDSDRRKASAAAIEWWKDKRTAVDAEGTLSVEAGDESVLHRALRCRLDAIRADAIDRLVAIDNKSALDQEMNVVSNLRRIETLFFADPQAAIECLLKYENYGALMRMTGVSRPNKTAWLQWWQENRPAWDFSITPPAHRARPSGQHLERGRGQVE